MDSDGDKESIEGDLNTDPEAAHWGKTKYDYYYTDYVDKDYPSKLTAKEEKLAAIEQEEALRIQKRLLSTLEDTNFELAFDLDESQEGDQGNLLDIIREQNKSLSSISGHKEPSKKRKRVSFEGQNCSDSDGINDDDDESEEDSDAQEDEQEQGRQRRPINIAMKKNRGLTPYKKKEYRNPRVKHKLKYKKAMSKRRRNVKEAKVEFHRYSGEASGIKTSTIKSVRLC